MTGRSLHGDGAAPQQPSNLVRRLFPAQVLKSAAMAHRLATLADECPDDALLVLCGSSHMLFGHGVPERLFEAVPRLQAECCRVVAHQEEPSDEAPSDEAPSTAADPAAHLKAAFGTGTDAADLAFIYAEWENDDEAADADAA